MGKYLQNYIFNGNWKEETGELGEKPTIFGKVSTNSSHARAISHARYRAPMTTVV